MSISDSDGPYQIQKYNKIQQGSSIRFVQEPDCVPADAVGAGPPYIYNNLIIKNDGVRHV